MATESSVKRLTFEDLIFMLFAVLIVSSTIQRIPVLLQEQLGVDVGSKYLVASAAVSDKTPLGSRVNTPEGTPYYQEPNTTNEPLGTFAPGTSLFLSDGPTTAPLGRGRFWYVEDTETGAIGWVQERALVREGVGGVTDTTSRGTVVRALLDVSLWDQPGSDTKVGTMKKGERAAIADGPIEEKSSRWWYVDREGEDDGWVTDAALTLASDTNWYKGSVVRAVHDSDLFDRPGGGNAVGVLREEEQAAIVGGAENIAGAYWWLVKTDDGTQGWVAETALEDGGVRGWFKGVLAVILTVGTILMVLLLGGIVYATIRTNQIRAKETRRIREAVPKTMQPKRNERWDTVLTHVSSENPNDWRLAIIEADVMLDELITRMGYLGSTLGERLKQISRGDMQTLDAAWEAHKVRNQIAHAGTDFILTKREARRVVDLYGAVFEEFKFI